MTKRFSSKIKTIIVVVLVFMILTAIIGIIVNRKDNVVVSSFSLSVNGDVISSDKSGYIVTIDNPLSVEVLFPSNVAAEDMSILMEFRLQRIMILDFMLTINRILFRNGRLTWINALILFRLKADLS